MARKLNRINILSTSHVFLQHVNLRKRGRVWKETKDKCLALLRCDTNAEWSEKRMKEVLVSLWPQWDRNMEQKLRGLDNENGKTTERDYISKVLILSISVINSELGKISRNGPWNTKRLDFGSKHTRVT